MEHPIDDGGPAFPMVWGGGAVPGMSLRDWLAGQAMVGQLASPWHPDMGVDPGWKPSILAEVAYEIADAMLRKRKEGK